MPFVQDMKKVILNGQPTYVPSELPAGDLAIMAGQNPEYTDVVAAEKSGACKLYSGNQPIKTYNGLELETQINATGGSCGADESPVHGR